ncbi:MAG: SPRY domain-containing protein [bacterium]|nr:SPRY domain-containing protein [bacterium]
MKSRSYSLQSLAVLAVTLTALLFTIGGIEQGTAKVASVRWFTPVGAGLVAPACGSSSLNGSPTCNNGQPVVTFSWANDNTSSNCWTWANSANNYAGMNILVNGASVYIAPGGIGPNNFTSSYTWTGGSPGVTYTYELSCYYTLDPSQTDSFGSGTFTMPSFCAPRPTATISASPNPIASGERSTLTWGSTDATSCTAGGPWSNVNNIFTPPSGVTSVDYLIVAGGGGGGRRVGGGGGAGGMLTGTTPVSPGNYAVTVGAGGSGATTHTVAGGNGLNSVFNTITAIGGGGGASYDTSPATNGGSGGGANKPAATSVPGTGTAGQGYDGGTSAITDYTAGGGGAGAVGGSPSTSVGGVGGAGLSSSITGSSVMYAGGGGGSGDTTVGAGGSGGGGAGSKGNNNATNGTANTGGGGGGSRAYGGGAGNGGSGGSGVVIIRYLKGGGSCGAGGTITESGGYCIHTFTAGLSGSGLTDPLFSNTTFTFQCTGPGGTSLLASVAVSTVGSLNGACDATHYNCTSGTNVATWNPNDKDTDVTLSNGNLTAASPTGGIVRSTIGKSSGKWYMEITETTVGATGIANSSAALTAGLGVDINGWAYLPSSGSKRNNNSSVAYGTAYTNGAVIGVALDMDAGEVTFYKNNVTQGVAYTGLTGTIYIAVGASSQTGKWTANFGATPFTYTPPAGFVAFNGGYDGNGSWIWSCNVADVGTNDSCSEPILPTSTITQTENITMPAVQYTIDWNSTDADTCGLYRVSPNGQWTTVYPPNTPPDIRYNGTYTGSQTVIGIHTWHLTCSNGGGTATTTLAHTVLSPPSVSATKVLRAAPSILRVGETTKISWEVSNVQSCTVTGTNGTDSWNGASSAVADCTTKISGACVSSPVTGQTTYTLSCLALEGATPSTYTDTETVNLIPVINEG